MRSKPLMLMLISLAIAVGAAIPSVIVWNPAHWHWADRALTWVHAAAVPPADSEGAGTAVPSVPRKIKYWRAPMDPTYISDKPGKSPMGMDLIPVYEGEEPSDNVIHVSPAFVQNFSVRTAVVETGSIASDIRTVGVLAYNEQGIVSVNTKFDGWIEKAKVNFVGQDVAKGQVLFEIYSPQLVTTQQEYLAAIGFLDRLSAGGDPGAVERARALVEASKERLRYWDISDDQIGELTANGKVTRTLRVLSPASGVVIEKMSDSLEGMRLSPGMTVFKIADLGTLWAEVEVFESDIQHLRMGQRARMEIDAFPGRSWLGRVVRINPTVNPQTRTLTAYIEVPNPGRLLRPQMYANVSLEAPSVRSVVRVPEEAILHSGIRNVVIVQKDATGFEPREVELGASGGGFTEIRKGVDAGERVVTSSQFLIDSESNLKEAIRKILGDPNEMSMPPVEVPKPVNRE
jgi:membrane fusion protein, copper/silver efflux system